MFCIKCGNRVDYNKKYCSNCGNDLSRQKRKNNNVIVNVSSHSSDKGLVSLIIGVICLFNPLFFPLAILGLIFGLSERENDSKKIIGIVLNCLSLLISIVLFILFVLFLIGVSVDEEYRNERYYYNDNEDFYYSNQIVGNDIYGYIEIPNNWYRYEDISSDKVSYKYLNQYSVSLDIIDSESSLEKIVKFIEKDLDDVNERRVSFLGYDAYIINGTKYNYYTDIYVFEAEDKLIHYIQVEGKDRNDSVFQIPYSFRLKNSLRYEDAL